MQKFCQGLAQDHPVPSPGKRRRDHTDEEGEENLGPSQKERRKYRTQHPPSSENGPPGPLREDKGTVRATGGTDQMLNMREPIQL